MLKYSQNAKDEDQEHKMRKTFGIVFIYLFVLIGSLYSVTITSPKAGDTWHTGYYQTITWDSPRNALDKVRVYLLSAESGKTVQTLYTGEDKGSCRWRFYRNSTPLGLYKILVSIDGSSTESGPFEIKESFIRVTYPIEMIKVIGPSTVRVTWESSEEMKTVRITKIYNGKETGSDVIENNNYYDFVIDELMHGGWRFKIANGNMFNHFDYSQTIMISQPFLKIKIPSAGKSYRIGQTIGISWEAKDFDKAVRIELWDWNAERLTGIIKDEIIAETYSWDSFSLEGKSLDWELLTGKQDHQARSAMCFVKVVSLNIPNLSAKSSFITLQVPLMDEVLEVYRPSQGDRLVMGKTQAIVWHVRDDRFAEEDIDIHLYRDETLITTIGKAKLKERDLSWAVPHGLAEGSQYRFKLELPRYRASTFSKYIIIHGDYCFSNKVKVRSLTLDKDSYLYNEDIEMRAELENPSADPISGTMRLYIKNDPNELGQYLGEMEIKMAPESQIELAPILIKADMFFNSPGKYSRIFQPKIIPKNLDFMMCDCVGKFFTIDASLQIPCGVELIDFAVDKAKYYKNEKLEYSFTLYNRSEHPFQGDVLVTGSSGFKEAELYKGNNINLGQDQRKQITGSLPVKDIVDGDGRYELKLKGQFWSSDAIVESGKAEIRRGPKIEVIPQVDVHSRERVDLAIDRCRFVGKREFQSGEKGKVYLVLRNRGNVKLTEYRIRAWSVVGSPQKMTELTVKRLQERGNVTFNKTYKKILQPGKTSTETLIIPFQERKSGAYTLHIEASPVVPEDDANPKNNQKILQYKFKVVLQIKKE